MIGQHLGAFDPQFSQDLTGPTKILRRIIGAGNQRYPYFNTDPAVAVRQPLQVVQNDRVVLPGQSLMAPGIAVLEVKEEHIRERQNRLKGRPFDKAARVQSRMNAALFQPFEQRRAKRLLKQWFAAGKGTPAAGDPVELAVCQKLFESRIRRHGLAVDLQRLSETNRFASAAHHAARSP